jgi:hypothetical protein
MIRGGIMVSLKSHDPKKSATKGSALQQFRARQKRDGMARLELQVRREDAGLMRHIARDLADPSRSAATRQALLACINQNRMSLICGVRPIPAGPLPYELSA